MKVLIVENELYLAQSIAAKLNDIGYTCEFASTAKEAIRDEKFDVVLLSTNISDQNFSPVLKHYKKSIVILMVSYINEDTVGKPLKEGACDYLLKPFMIEELIRKIRHFKAYRQLQDANNNLNSYIDHTFVNVKVDAPECEELPLLIKTNHQKSADVYAMNLAKDKNLAFEFISLPKTKVDSATLISTDKLYYISGFQTLKKSEKESFLKELPSENIIISTTDLNDEVENIEILEIKSENKSYEDGDILSIEEYVKHILLSHQHKYPDTELSKKLGISRKSLWEKRKKYGIIKKASTKKTTTKK
jgi:DNA-binding NtrC family response regulator